MIKITIDSMRYGIVHAISDHHEEIERVVNEELTNLIKDFDFASVVRDHASIALKQAIKNYFSYGEGGKLIDDAVDEALGNVMKRAAEQRRREDENGNREGL